MLFGVLDRAIGEDGPVFSGVLFAVAASLFWSGYGMYRRREDRPTPLPDASGERPRG